MHSKFVLAVQLTSVVVFAFCYFIRQIDLIRYKAALDHDYKSALDMNPEVNKLFLIILRTTMTMVGCVLVFGFTIAIQMANK
jgi:hypothetical protein